MLWWMESGSGSGRLVVRCSAGEGQHRLEEPVPFDVAVSEALSGVELGEDGAGYHPDLLS
jgi:hypothetical protein